MRPRLGIGVRILRGTERHGRGCRRSKDCILKIETFQVTEFVENCYVVKDGQEAIIIDPGDVPDRLLRSLDGLKASTIVNTHGHCDHCGGNGVLIERTGAQLACHKGDVPLLRILPEQGEMFGAVFPPCPEPGRLLEEGDTVAVGGIAFRVLHTPGHSPGHIVLVGQGVAFVGDVLFAGSIGRTDLMGGNHAQLLDSIRSKLLSLPDETIVYPGHGPSTTIGEERRHNPFLVGL